MTASGRPSPETGIKTAVWRHTAVPKRRSGEIDLRRYLFKHPIAASRDSVAHDGVPAARRCSCQGLVEPEGMEQIETRGARMKRAPRRQIADPTSAGANNAGSIR